MLATARRGDRRGRLRLVRAAHGRALDPGRLRRHADGDRHHERGGPARASRRALGRRGEGFIQLTQRDGRPAEGLRVCARTSPVAAGRPVLFNVVLAVNGMRMGAQDVRGLARELSRARASRCSARRTRSARRSASRSRTGTSSTRARLGTGRSRARTRTRSGSSRTPSSCARWRRSTTRGMLQTPILGGPVAGHVFEGAKNAPALDRFIGRTVGEIAEELGVHPVEAAGRLSLASDLTRGLPDQERDQRQRASTSASCSPRRT